MPNNPRNIAFLSLLRTHLSDVRLLLFLAAGLTGVVVQWLHPADSGDEMMRLAGNLAATGSYRDPFRVMATGPTAMNPPLYPLMVACLMRILKLPTLVYQAIVLGSIIANAVTAILFPRVAKLFFNDELPGVAASLLWVTMMPCFPGWDTSYTATGVLLFCLLTGGINVGGWRAFRKASWAGVVAGLLFLLNPSVLLVLAPWMAYTVWCAQESRASTVRALTIALGGLAVSVCLWCTRNYLVLGAFTTRTNLGPTLYASNNDCATPSLVSEEFSGCYQEHHPNTNPAEAQAVKRFGEVRYDRLKTDEVERWIASHKHRFLRLSLSRAAAFWFPTIETTPANLAKQLPDRRGSEVVQSWIDQQNLAAYSIRIATILSIAGFVLMVRNREPVVWFVAAAFVTYPILYYVVVSDMRYRYPILWLTLLSAGYLIRLLEPNKAHPNHSPA